MREVSREDNYLRRLPKDRAKAMTADNPDVKALNPSELRRIFHTTGSRELRSTIRQELDSRGEIT